MNGKHLVVVVVALAWAGPDARGDVTIEVADQHLDFRIGKEVVTRYHKGPQLAKPYFWPLVAPGGVSVTRSWPVEKQPTDETTDHIHQKSLWFTHGDVIPEGLPLKTRVNDKNVQGVDFWSERDGHGTIVCVEVGKPASAGTSASIVTRNEWRTADGDKILDEIRAFTLHDLTPDAWLLVVDIELAALFVPVTFGDTKEGAFGLRIHDAIRLANKKGQGKLVNADGASGELACWGFHSPWCDYSGPIDGKVVGAAIFDDLDNPFPACWHARGYGLLAANPFGRTKSGFPAVRNRSDLVRLDKGERLRLRYGVLVHQGDADEAKIAQHHRTFQERKDLPASVERQVIRLWKGKAPGAQGDDDADRPTITFYRPAKPNATAVVVCPGGGYGNLAMDHEGRQVAQWLNRRGVAAFVLAYRLGPRYRHPAPLLDAQRALRVVRHQAKEWNVDPNKIGMWGFSAGGHLASTAGTRFDAGLPDADDPIDRIGCRPDFLILAYPVITFADPTTHKSSRSNLLGPDPDPKLVESLCNDQQVTEKTPPTFLFHTNEDSAVAPENSILFYQALRKAKVPVELHVYEKGKHGVGLASKDPVLSSWPDRLADWLRSRGLLDTKDGQPSTK
jgi:acetyl esterase/lipase